MQNKSVIIRSRQDQSKQMQLLVDFKSGSIGVIHNLGLEMIVIDSILNKDVGISYNGEPADQKNQMDLEFDPAKTLMRT